MKLIFVLDFSSSTPKRRREHRLFGRIMHTIVLKYVQLFCIALLFDNVSCDNISLEASRNDMLLNREVGCMAACMQMNLTAV